MMTDKKLVVKTEPIDPWVAINCNGGCQKPAEWQEVVFRGSERLSVKVGHCGNSDCQKNAAKKALEMAGHPTVQRLADVYHGRGAEGII